MGRKKTTRPDTEIWMRSFLDDDAIMAMKAREFTRKFNAACRGEINEFQHYVRVLPAGSGPPED